MGIDPGQSGGIALLDTGGAVVLAEKMPATEKDVSDLIYEFAPCIRMGAIEQVHSMPKQGVASSFKFGVNYGGLRMALVAHEIPFEAITPQTWQKAMGCMSRGDKNRTKARAQ